MGIRIKDLPEEEYFTSGHTACAGCGASMAAKIAMKVFGPNTIVYNPACCLLVFSGTYPLISWKVPYHHVLFENTGACITGIRRALIRQKKEGINVVGIAGDGGTADIGIQSLSGAAERNEDVIYIMYDNEAYMNTGIQRSGSTPYGANTTTTPVGKVRAGKLEMKKDMAQIMIAHNIPYVATASIGFPMDFLAKLEKLKNIKGCRFLQVFTPCPTGWRHDTDLTVEVAKQAFECGLWNLFEYENGKFTLNKKPKMIPVKDYIKTQGRFKHFTDTDIQKLQEFANFKTNYYNKMAECWK